MTKSVSTIEIRAEANPHVAGSLDFYAFLTPPDVTGSVYWYVDQAYITSNGLTNGLVTGSSISISPAGDHLVMVVYSGDSNYLPSCDVIVQTAT